MTTARGSLAASQFAAFRRSSWPTVLAIVASLALHVTVSLAARLPTYTDEVGYLANAQLISGVGSVRHLLTDSYGAGWSVILAPLFWTLSSPDAIYRGAVLMSGVLGGLVVIPLIILSRTIITSPRVAAAAAFAIAASPARSIHSRFATSENLLTLVFLTVVAISVYSLRQSAPRISIYLVAALAAFGFLTHGRGVLLLLAGAGVILVTARRARLRHAIIAGGLLVGLAVGAAWINGAFADLIYVEDVDRTTSTIEKIVSSTPSAWTLSALGQLWYQNAAWAGLSALGAIWILRRCWKDRRTPRIGPWLIAAVTVGGASVMSISSINKAYLEVTSDRLDVFVYGRYLDNIAPALTLLGLSVVIRVTTRRRFLGVWAALVAGVSVLFVALNLPRIPASGWPSPLNVGGLTPWQWPAFQLWDFSDAEIAPWAAISLWVPAAALVMVMLSGRARTLVASLIPIAVLATAVGISTTTSAFARPFETGFSAFRYVPAGAVVDFDTAGADFTSTINYQFFLFDHDVRPFDSTTDRPFSTYVIARKNWPTARLLQAVPVASDPIFDNTLWEIPR